MERDAFTSRQGRISTISTHTLTWSVTIIANMPFNDECISTHTLTWSVTGGDVIDFCANCISTHTLTWSVTVYGTYERL